MSTLFFYIKPFSCNPSSTETKVCGGLPVMRWTTPNNNVPGFKTWRRLNDAISALLAAGLHENAREGHNVPFFLIEIRKRIFARLYGIDIGLATFLGRPPRISKRFCSINLPLDLDEDVFFLSGEALDRELVHLDQNGWNTQGHVRTTAVMRWSIITAMIREDTLELLLGQNIPDMQQRIWCVTSTLYTQGI